MERFETPHVRVNLYDGHTSIKDIAVEKIKLQAEPKREDPDDPFIIYDLGDIVSKDDQWRRLLPNIETFFAVKCNPDPVLIRLLMGLGRSFDCASKKEIAMVLDLGASPDRIIFAHPYKQESHLRFAREKGVQLMTFDTEEELLKIKRVYPEAKLVLRVRFDDWSATIKLGAKFGCHDNEVHPLMECAKRLGLQIVGMSFHIGSESTNPQIFSDVIRHIRPMFETGTSLGFDMKILDLGGGFPGRLHPKATFDEFADVIREALKTNFPPSSGVRVIAEPGSFYTRSAGYLVTNIIAKRVYKTHGEAEVVEKVKVASEPTIWMYYLNVGVFNALMGVLLDPEYFDLPELLSIREEDKSPVLRPSCIWGPTCDGTDVIFSRCMMPEMEAGEFVIFHDAGGYVAPCACDFNGFGLPPLCYIAPKETRAVLKRVFST